MALESCCLITVAIVEAEKKKPQLQCYGCKFERCLFLFLLIPLCEVSISIGHYFSGFENLLYHDMASYKSYTADYFF